MWSSPPWLPHPSIKVHTSPGMPLSEQAHRTGEEDPLPPPQAAPGSDRSDAVHSDSAVRSVIHVCCLHWLLVTLQDSRSFSRDLLTQWTMITLKWVQSLWSVMGAVYKFCPRNVHQSSGADMSLRKDTGLPGKENQQGCGQIVSSLS